MNEKNDKNVDTYEAIETDINLRFPVGSNKGTNKVNADKVKKELIKTIVQKDKKEFQMNLVTGILLPLGLFCYSIMYSNIAVDDVKGYMLGIIIVVIVIWVVIYGIMYARTSNQSRNLSFKIEILQRKREELLSKS